MEYIVFILLGLTMAGFEALLLIRFSKNLIANTIGILGGIGALLAIWDYSYRILMIKDLRIQTFGCFVFSFGLGFCILLWLFSKIFIKSLDDKYSLRMSDILLGNVKALENHTNNRQKQIDAELNYHELYELKESNEKQFEELTETKSYLLEKEKDMLHLKKYLDENLSKTVCLELPLNYKYPVTINYLNNMESYIKAFVKFDNYIFDTTEQFIENQNENSDRDLQIFLKTYLNFLCLSTSKILFGYHEGVRTHVRYLKDGYYETIACCVGEIKSDKDLTKIPLKKGMIDKSNVSKQSLIKSCNLEYHYSAQNDHVWKDYITIPIIEIEKKHMPLLSIGISIKYPGIHSDILKFLNFIKIETVYSKNICKINKYYDILKIISEGV